MKAVIWTPGQPLGEWSAERVDEIRGDITGPIVAVLDDNDGVMVFQPIDPQTGAAWESEADALAFANRYMSPAPAVPEEDPAS